MALRSYCWHLALEWTRLGTHGASALSVNRTKTELSQTLFNLILFVLVVHDKRRPTFAGGFSSRALLAALSPPGAVRLTVCSAKLGEAPTA
jgi:hypothetical protein